MTAERLNLLLINWQDIGNPLAGGAEIHLHEIFGRLADRGHRVTLLCSGWPGCPARERVGGLEVHRTGGRHTFALQALPYYRRRLAAAGYDVVVEDINKIPLFSPLWTGAPVVALVPHLFGATAFREASAPMAAAVWLAERPLARVYGDLPFQAISNSTKDDLARRGIPESQIRVIYPGVDHSVFRPDPTVREFDEPTAAYVGRLKRYKGLRHVIDAVARLRAEGLRVRLVMAGKGDHESTLRLYAERQAPGVVDFRGFISEEAKVDLLRRAWTCVYPSPKEGWGITNIEAAACGTPAVASDSPGLRESVAHEKSGLLVRHGDVKAWVAALRRVVSDTGLRHRLRAGAIEFAARFTWDRAADETEAHLQEVVFERREPDRRGLAESGTEAK